MCLTNCNKFSFWKKKSWNKGIQCTVGPNSFQYISEIEVCKIKADVILVYDSSTSIGEEHYAKQFEFSKKLIKNFDVGFDAVRFAAILFSRTVKLLFTLKENDDYNSIDKVC